MIDLNFKKITLKTKNHIIHLTFYLSKKVGVSVKHTIVYLKYFLPGKEYKQFITELKNMLENLQLKIHPHAFEYVRGQMGIKSLDDLDILLSFPKNEIEYNKFDK